MKTKCIQCFLIFPQIVRLIKPCIYTIPRSTMKVNANMNTVLFTPFNCFINFRNFLMLKSFTVSIFLSQSAIGNKRNVVINCLQNTLTKILLVISKKKGPKKQLLIRKKTITRYRIIFKDFESGFLGSEFLDLE